jgi:hypothetical protein
MAMTEGPRTINTDLDQVPCLPTRRFFCYQIGTVWAAIREVIHA